MNQSECLSESININDISKICESISVSSFSQSGGSTTYSKIKTNNNSLHSAVNMCNESNIENNYVRTAESLVENGEDFDDVKNDQYLMSLALKISKSDLSAEYAEDFIDKRLTNNSTSNAISASSNTSVIEHNGYQNNESFKTDEEFRLKNGLKILESLVNTEHAKLDVEGESSTELELQPDIETVEINYSKVSSNSNSSENNNFISKEKAQKKLEQDRKFLKDKELKIQCTKYETISNKKKNHENKSSKNNNKKLDVPTNLFESSSSSSMEIQNNQYISVAVNSSQIPSSSQKIDSKISTNTKTTKSVKIQLESQNLKNNSITSKSKTHSSNAEKLHINGKYCNSTLISNGSTSVLPIKTNPIASTSSYNEKDDGNLKNKSSNPSSSGMKTSDYKKIYEMDRKSLFNPDIVFVKPKRASDSVNGIKNNNQSKEIKGKSQQILEMTKDKICKSKIKNNAFFNRKKKLDNRLKVKITCNNSKKSQLSKPTPSNSTCSLNPKSSHSTKSSHNKFKRLKIYDSDNETDKRIGVNKNEKSNVMATSDNQESITTNTSENTDVFKSSLSESLRIIYERVGCKPCSVFLHRVDEIK